jgi:hypothetical protein
MTHDPTTDPMYGRHASPEARYIFAYLHRRGGTMRLRPMLRHLRMEPRAFIDATVELHERYWIRIVWRPAPPDTPEDAPRDYTEIERLVTTRFGRKKYRTS